MEILDVPQDQLPDACCHLTIYMIEDTDKLSAVPNIIMSQAMSPFAKLLLPLLKLRVCDSL